ncbi:MAG: dehydrogenase [Paracoccaceae bacterium]|nr:MAG: dehydrogenase [Paracoccaceae bacterium]
MPRALWHVAPGRSVIAPAAEGSGEVLVRTLWSGLSRGTERLVAEGRVPPSEHGRMRAPRQEGTFPFPVKYGYAAVGLVEAGPPALAGRMVFALHPHQTAFRAAPGDLLPLPGAVPPRRAILAANMETALNAIWDAEPAPGSRVLVIGAGTVGCLTARLAATMGRCQVILIDRLAERRGVAHELGVSFATSTAGIEDADLVFHCSASAAGLADGLAALGFEGRLIEMSWYGDAMVPVPLGGAFHSRRLRIISSQVGAVAPSRRANLTPRDRLARALALLDDPALDALITHEVAFDDLPAALPGLLSPENRGCIGVAVRYPARSEES